MAYDTLASKERLEKTIAALTKHHFRAESVATKEEALARVKDRIQEGASVMNGASRTLEQIGYQDYLASGEHAWRDLHAEIRGEDDDEKRAMLRRQSVSSDWYLGSAHAVTEDGQLFFASNSGSQLPHLAYTSPNIVLVIGTHKIVQDLAEAQARLDAHVIPLEDVRMREAYGYGTGHMKTLILREENPALGRNVHVILVDEVLGF